MIMSAPFMALPASGCGGASARLSFEARGGFAAEGIDGTPLGTGFYTADRRGLRRSTTDGRRCRAHDRESSLRMTRAQDLLVELAHARLRNLLDEGPALGQPPARDAVGEERAQRLRARAAARASDHARDRALVPARVRHADHGSLEDIGMRHERVLELHGRDPLAAGLDHVLRP